MPRSTTRILLSLVLVICHASSTAAAGDSLAMLGRLGFATAPFVLSGLLMLPPAVRLAIGQGQRLREDCSATVPQGGVQRWMDSIDDADYRLGAAVFETIWQQLQARDAASTSDPVVLWFPRLDSASKLDALQETLINCKDELGISAIKLDSWPNVPSTKLEIIFDLDDDSSNRFAGSMDTAIDEVSEKSKDCEHDIQASIDATEIWVREKLCKLALCPYTASLQRAAVGLESVGVEEGPIIVQHAIHQTGSPSFQTVEPRRLATACLAHAFWKSVVEVVESPETKISTTLIIAPQIFDDDFAYFCRIFDNLVEPSIQATSAQTLVGRALFHPSYDSRLVLPNEGHMGAEASMLAGHALPPAMLRSFIERYSSDDESPDQAGSGGVPSKGTLQQLRTLPFDEIAKANDAVRWTPHATINLLRRSQLAAAGQLEASLPPQRKRPNFIYVKNVARIIQQWRREGQE